ncbi:uncharacterized protein LOC122670490 isoform X2 [Telopea speciosissima]|uniref:uncharacterized protein LOC122670490 isoform X2 n=1 Tax=Telopea speciosissima TaxID=54955 RepID=UPI001CC5181D|nr:uncharacterized protein LOC122670490 isoform X2 [Telopea speciosissima]
MGNCQAVDTATLVIQHPSGKVERLYWPVSANEVMRTNPGHHVALVLTFCLPPPSKEKDKQEPQQQQERPINNNNEVRITRVKVLRPTDTLVLGQAYRLVSSQEVMKGLWARKYAKMKKERNTQSNDKPLKPRPKQQGSSPCETETESTSPQLDNPNQLQVAKNERHRPRTASASAPSASTRSRTWRPSLQSISEAGS